MIDKKTQGKRNRAAGTRFELKVRKDLESKGWICSKWMNNVELVMMTKSPEIESEIKKNGDVKIIVKEYEKLFGKLVPAKHKFRGPGIPMSIGTGFPDFIAFRRLGEFAKPFQEESVDDSQYNMEIGVGDVTLEKKIPRKKVGSIPAPKTPRPPIEISYQETGTSYEVIGVEAKSNGYLDKTEKEKCKWLIQNNTFSKILIAAKGDKRGTIKYTEVSK